MSPLLLLSMRGFIQSLPSYEVDAERDQEEEEESMAGGYIYLVRYLVMSVGEDYVSVCEGERERERRERDELIHNRTWGDAGARHARRRSINV